MYLAVETNATTAQEAQQKNAEIMDKAVKAILAQGIIKEKIETMDYSLQEQYDYNNPVYEIDAYGGKNQKYNKYFRVTNRIKITVEDFEKVGKIIDAGVMAGANRVDNIQFSLTNQKKLDAKKQALRQAGKEAKDKVEALADSVGTKLGKLASVNENSYDNYPRPYYNYRDFAVAAKMESAPAETPVEPAKVGITATVTVSYEID